VETTMSLRLISIGVSVLTLGGCTELGQPGGVLLNVPESVVEIAAPNQDLSTVRLLEDNCFWYQHQGPVETTLLPLRDVSGRPICTRAEA
jgi:hypothetical protein